MKIAVVTDTNSGIDKKMSKKLGVYVIPMPVIVDDKTFYEGYDLTEKRFFDMLNAGKNISTSQPSVSSIKDVWDNLLNSGYDEIIHIPMSSSLSKSCETSLCLSKDYNGRVKVVDNHRLSVTLMESVIQAKKLISKGMNSDEVKNFLEKDSYNSVIYFSVNDLNYLKRGGRINSAVAMLGTIFSIKPILTLQGGKVEFFTKIRGNIKKCEYKMIELIKSDLNNRFSKKDKSNLKIGSAGAGLNEHEKMEWISLLKENFPNTEVYYAPLSASISCHTGPGTIGVAASFREI